MIKVLQLELIPCKVLISRTEQHLDYITQRGQIIMTTNTQPNTVGRFNAELSLKEAQAISVDVLTQLTVDELSFLLKVLERSDTKVSKRKADLVKGIMKTTILKNAPKETQQIVAEHSKKKTPKKSPKALKEQIKEAEAEVKEEETKPAKASKKSPKKSPKQAEEKAEERVEEPKKPKSLKKKKKDVPNPAKMSQEELIEYAKQLQEASETFPKVMDLEKTVFTMTDFETVEDIQEALVTDPYTTYIFVDEKIDKSLTQFIVVYANSEVIVLVDKNREVNSTITIKHEQMDADHITINKTQFEYSFYTRKNK